MVTGCSHLKDIPGYEFYGRMQGRTTVDGVEEMAKFFVNFGGMPYERAEASMRTFASQVAPELRKIIPLQRQQLARTGCVAA